MDTITPMTSSNNVSPYFITPVKTTPRRAANSGGAGDIEAATSLIGFSETSTSGSIAGRNASSAPSSLGWSFPLFHFPLPTPDTLYNILLQDFGMFVFVFRVSVA